MLEVQALTSFSQLPAPRRVNLLDLRNRGVLLVDTDVPAVAYTGVGLVLSNERRESEG